MSEYQSVLIKGAKTTVEEKREKAVLVGVERPGMRWNISSSLAELERLADTAGADTVAVPGLLWAAAKWKRSPIFADQLELI